MKKPLVVLLLRIAGAPDQPTKQYADALFTSAGLGTRNLVDYYDEMSHGSVDLSGSVVYDWIDYEHTPQDVADFWAKSKKDKKAELVKAGVAEAKADTDAAIHANGAKRAQIVDWARQAAAVNHFDLSGYAALVCVFNQGIDYFGSAGVVVIGWNPTSHQSFSVDLTGVAHEVGHALGLASHSRLEGSAEEYADTWDAMSVYNGVFYNSAGVIAAQTPYYTFGPGLNAVNMNIAGWLDPTRVFNGGGWSGCTFKLRPLHRRDLPGWLAAKISLGFETIYLEFRVPDRWDSSIPNACVLAHRHSTHPGDGRPCSELLLNFKNDPIIMPRPDLGEGDSLERGDASDPFGFYARLRVTQIDVANQEATINVYVRPSRQIEPAGTLYGAVTSDGGGLVWTPGRGFVRVPPRSPLLRVIDLIADYESLQLMSSADEAFDGDRISTEQLTKMRDHITRLVSSRTESKVPAPRSSRSDT